MCYTGVCKYEDAYGECCRGGFRGKPPNDAECYEGDEDETDIQSKACSEKYEA